MKSCEFDIEIEFRADFVFKTNFLFQKCVIVRMEVRYSI